MSYPPAPPGGSPEWPGQQPEWQGQPPGYPPQQPPAWPGQPPAGWPAPQPGWQGQPEPENYLVWAILCTVLCCLPLGIVSIVYSNKVSGLWAQGRYAEAQEAANNAKKWAIIGAIVGVVAAVIFVLIYVVAGVLVVSHLPSTTTTTYSGF
ncbi:CD225/dispanin family protein [Mycobacterium sp. WUMAC-067]|uniref:CD225/dispanin family protein n=1 Tax=unclassified Mycobacterium TaxID=2642494 RepID=UPI001CD9CDF2|nr:MULTISPECIES: CD225/dispanin family protein [unclassified Mycobacterium]MCA2241295.1 CD225/dispanin family protein [Mycobacterium sp. WUMAC-067]MCA2317435.1 CD225/dispanin family protein [Mycobacterium sp. WUMAC-025]